MIRLVLRGVVARRGRAALTGLSVLVGVAMIAGTFAYTDAVRGAFDELFSSAARGADVVVAPAEAGADARPGSVTPEVAARVRRVPGVAQAAGQVTGNATVLDREGRPVRRGNLPTVALSVLPRELQRVTYVHGRAPRDSGEVALDVATAERAGLEEGDRVRVATDEPARSFEISAVVRMGGAGAKGLTAPLVFFDRRTAQRLYRRGSGFDVLAVRGARGVTPPALVRRLERALPPALLARTSADQVEASTRQVGDRLQVLQAAVLAFALVAVLVGAFVIFNTFSITVAQRGQELALLRVVGAGRRHVFLAVVGEALVIGLVGTVLGLLAGLATAAGLSELFAVLGLELPAVPISLSARTVLVAGAAGLLATVLAVIVPALRATRVVPLAALRASLIPRPERRRKWPARVLAAVFAAAGVGGLLLATFARDADPDVRLAASAGGALALVFALALVTPPLVRPVANLLGRPLERRAALPGRLARENAARNPGRTAASASALMIGLALVLFVTVFADGLRQSSRDIIERTFGGDYALVNADGFSPIPASAARAAAITPDVQTVSSLKASEARFGKLGGVTAVGLDPSTIGDVYRLQWLDGSDGTLEALGVDGAIVERETARRAGVDVGDQVPVTTPEGRRATVRVRGIYRDSGQLEGFAIPQATHDRLFGERRLAVVFVKLTPKADRRESGLELREGLAGLPDVRARSQASLADAVTARVDRVLALFTSLLGMSVLVALLGLLATLTLSVHERRRELGLVRAVGMTRTDVRRTVRYEGLITAALGAGAGSALGLFLAWAATRALAEEGMTFHVPWLALGICIALALLAGALASVLPARRAARVPPLEALGLP